MKHFAWVCILGLGWACGGSDDDAGSGGDDADDDASVSSSGAGGSTGTSGGAGGSSGTGSSGTASWSAVHEGKATYYAATGGGNCSFDPTPNDLDVVALDEQTYGIAAMCGACLDVTGPLGTVRVRAVDRCPECEPGHLDLAKQAFVQIAQEKDGLVPVSYRFVPCAETAPVAYRYKTGSSRYYTAIQVLRHKLPITKLEYQKGDAWIAIERQKHNYFVSESDIGAHPNGLVLRVTAIDGQTLVDTLPPFGDEQLGTEVHDGAGQFE